MRTPAKKDIMRIVIITSNEPFYLASSLRYFLENKPDHLEVAACVIVRGAASELEKSIFRKGWEVWETFGFGFFLHYARRFITVKAGLTDKITDVLAAHNIPLIYLQNTVNSEESVTTIRRFGPDLLVSIVGGEIFRQPILKLAPKGCINLHTSLLPKYRGLMPTFWVLKNGEKQTGVSVFFMNEGIDDGPIIVQKSIEISVEMTQAELIRKSKRLGMDAIIEALKLIEAGSLDLIENNDDESTYYSLPSRQDVREYLASGARFY